MIDFLLEKQNKKGISILKGGSQMPYLGQPRGAGGGVVTAPHKAITIHPTTFKKHHN